MKIEYVNSEKNAITKSCEKYSMIILPVAIEEYCIRSLTIGDTVTMDKIGTNKVKIRFSNANWIFNTSLDLKFRNSSKLSTYLGARSATGSVFAIFKKHILVELAIENNQFHFCN